MTTNARHQATCLILAALGDGSRPGFGIITDVRKMSGGRVWLRAGSLYSVLDRLRADELVAVDPAELEGSRLRRYYRLSRADASRPSGADQPVAATADLRVGDADRDAAAAALGEHFAQGRLTAEELATRLGTALTAITQSEMMRAIRDLP